MDLIERQTVIEAIAYSIELCNKALDSMTLGGRGRYAVEVERNSLLKLKDDFKLLPSAQPDLDEWCMDCKEYDKEKHSCPRFNRVIREALKDAELESCEDAVSRKDAIRWVKTECNPYGKPTLDFESGKKVIEYLKRMSPVTPKAEQRWIPCSERLPEKGKDVLVTRHYLGEEDNNKSCYYTEVAARYGDDDNPDWISYSDEYKIHPKNHIVIAWQELPEAYKGDKREAD